MIVYNLGRQWFQFQVAADKARIAAGLKPGSVLKVEINDRDDLAALLNALCDAKPAAPLIERIVETAYVPPHVSVPDCIPKFLVREQEEREKLHERVRANKGGRA